MQSLKTKKQNLYEHLLKKFPDRKDVFIKGGYFDAIEKIFKYFEEQKISFYLIDENAILGDIGGNQIPRNPLDYILEPKKVFFTCTLNLFYCAQIDDPLSKEIVKTNSAGQFKIQDVLPGTWNLFIKDKNKKIIYSQEITVAKDKDLYIENLGQEQTVFEAEEFSLHDKKRCFKDSPVKKGMYFILTKDKAGGCEKKISIRFNSGINDINLSLGFSNFKYDKKHELYYTFIFYKDLRKTNQSGQPSFCFFSDGIKLLPQDLVNEDYIYTKYEGESNYKFQVALYDYQNEKDICSRLKNSVIYKTKKYFNFTKEEDKMQIANFRPVVATKNLYRSYHPYNDSKHGIPDTETSFLRTKYLTELAEKYKICADINLSDTEKIEATYGMPFYYKKILEEDNVLYMTDCSYNVCYENSGSKKFLCGIGKIIKFINKKNGPYLIHCAIGTDRTGIICAVIEILCGAQWKEIENDYCSSINMGIHEYRGPGCVRSAVENMLGIENIFDYSMQEICNMTKELLIQKGEVSKEEVEESVNRLKS